MGCMGSNFEVVKLMNFQSMTVSNLVGRIDQDGICSKETLSSENIKSYKQKIEKCLSDIRLFISSENGLLSSDDRGMVINKKLSKVKRLINRLPNDLSKDYKKQIKFIKSTPKRIENSRITSNIYLYPSIVSSPENDENYWCYRRVYDRKKNVKYIFFRKIRKSDIQQLQSTNSSLPRGKYIIGRAFSRQRPSAYVVLQ